MTQPGMLEFLTTMMRQGLEVVKQGPKAMTFQRMSNDGDEQTVVYLGPDVLLYLSENANPITYGSALEASRQIPQELNPPAVDFGNLF
jgi:DNA polymerase II large subunit